MEFDRNKFKALLHYVVWKAGGRHGFGTTELYRVLWLSDARAYMLTKQPITGEIYIREKNGPLPTHALGTISELERDNKISVWNDRYDNEPIQRFKSMIDPDKLLLDDEQRDIVDYWMQYIASERTAESINEESHDLAWKLAKVGEELPYYALFAARVRDPQSEELEWARSRATDLGLP
jgi:Protein of unknown function (DUF4065)